MPSFQPGCLDELRTERLVLRRPTAADRDDLARMHQDPVVMETLGGVASDAECEERLRRLLGHWDANGFGYWVAREPDSERFAGRGGLRLMVVEGEPAVELGYGFMSEYWGRGIATELAAAAVRAAFEVVGLRELVCFTMVTNLRSQNVMNKVGFRYEKDFVYADLEHRLCRLDAGTWRASAAARDPA